MTPQAEQGLSLFGPTNHLEVTIEKALVGYTDFCIHVAFAHNVC